ncbi:MAG: adenosylcobinamide-GDP ribazoletransferase, partial [Firmicutes bacterium]|nr:adenosylcobinamide-GDP ribazoletransferase [Bacillota bacterium]
VVSRCCLVWAIFLFPYVRSQGQGNLYKAYTGWQEVAAATVFTGYLCLGIGGIWGFFLAVASFPVTFILGRFFCRLFGGLTGDHYGAVNEVTELFILAAGLAVFR